MQIVNCLPLFSSRNICRARWRVTFHTISHFVHFLVTKEGFRCSNVTKLDCLRSNVTKSPLTYSNVTQKQDSDGEACSAYISFFAQDCLLTGQEQSCRQQGQECGMIGQANLLRS